MIIMTHYVDETEKQLKIRFPEHKNHINRNNPSNFVITEHRLISQSRI